MNQKYFSLLTKLGQARIINAQALGKTVKLTTLKVGDGGEDGGKETNPKETDTALVREKWQGPINSIFQDPDNDHWLVIETVIPEEDGNFYITEFGLYDTDDNLIAIGKYPKTYKPTLAQGSGSSLYIKVIFELSNTANVELKIDPAIVLASRSYVENLLANSFSQMPIAAEILNDDNRLKVNLSSQLLTIKPNQIIRWRGWKNFNTASYSEGERTFSYEQDKTYHLRWSPSTGFNLRDLEDSTYNTHGLDEQHVSFDSSYDDVLLGKIESSQFYPAIIASKRIYRPQISGKGTLWLPLGYRDRSFRLLVTIRNQQQKGNILIQSVDKAHTALFTMRGNNHGDQKSVELNSDDEFWLTSNNSNGEVSISTLTGDIIDDLLYMQNHQSEYVKKVSPDDTIDGDEELFSMGIKRLTTEQVKKGLPLEYEDIESATITFEVF
ncbi:phage tail protein [Spartinivicinus ruber]|uniref:phage tail protein n=1 Tax=Spartinivicinus ruber TaxID=2683272 RepID=UPI0013D014CD|nr:phage tail protein [Spartinivicinus ruber]